MDSIFSAKRTQSISLLAATILTCVSLLTMAFGPMSVSAIQVTSTNDVLDDDDGVCTLREAIIAANMNQPSGEMSGECRAGQDTKTDNIILVNGATYSLTIDSTPDEDGAQNGDLDIWDNTATTDLIIGVSGNGTATISQDAASDDRVLHILGATVKLDGLTLTGGASPTDGGGIALHGGDLTMKSIDIVANSALWGGGISAWDGALKMNQSNVAGNTAMYNSGGILNGGALKMSASSVNGNSVPAGDNPEEKNCGGLNNVGTVKIDNSTISENTVAWNGAGICNWDEGTMTIADSTISGNSGEDDGGGIINTGKLEMYATEVSNNSSVWGGGILNGGTLQLSASTISNNHVSNSGGGVANWPQGNITIFDSTISGNSAPSAGGLVNWGDGVVTITNSTVSGNSAPDDRGGGLFNDGTLTVNTSLITGNTAGWGGGLWNIGMLTLDASTVSENTANCDGGGLQNEGTAVIQNGSQINGNSAQTCSGGAIWNNENGTLTVTGSTISGNFAGDAGGGIANANMLTIDASSVSNNTANNEGGGLQNREAGAAIIQSASVFSENSTTAGGGVANYGMLTINESTVSSNLATWGGGIFNFGTLEATGSTISKNQAERGGGMWGPGNATLNSCTVSKNSASNSGGGIINWFGGTLTVTATTISDNFAEVEGGGLVNRPDATMIVDSSVLSGNTTNGLGGALLNQGELTVQNGTHIKSNSAIDGGGINNQGMLTIDFSILSANSAPHQGGALYNSGTATIANGTLVGGAAAEDANTTDDGGGGLFNIGKLNVIDSIITGNHAAYYGGGLFNWTGGMLTIDNTTVSNNSANQGGGLHNKEDSTAIIQNGTIFMGNYAEWSSGGIDNWGTITITDSTLRENNSAGTGDAIGNGGPENSTASITLSCILHNGDTAVFNSLSTPINATGNWWGDASGPSGVGPGSGDSVSDNVDFSGWLAEPLPIPGCGATDTILIIANQPDWVDSGITVSAGESFSINALGLMNPCSDTYPNGADYCVFYSPLGAEGLVPYENEFGIFPGPGLRFMALLGRIGDGEPFYIGAGDTFIAEEAGTLWLTPNDNLRTDNQGAYSVLVRLEP